MSQFALLPSVYGRARLVGIRAVLVALFLVAVLTAGRAFAQSARPDHPPAAKETKSAPAPYHDLSGTWEPANAPGDGIQPIGAKAMPSDGKPEHQLPYTPLGLATYKSHKALDGVDAV